MSEKMSEMPIQKRRGLIVWVYSLRQLKNLRRYGFVHYVSRKMKYVVLYKNKEDVKKSLIKIQHIHIVRQVYHSYRPYIDMNFSNKIGTKAEFQAENNKEN